MPELKRTFLKGRMNQDLDERLLPTGEYFDATNIQVSTSEGSDVGAIETVLGNTLHAFTPSGGTWTTSASGNFGLSNPQCIGVTRDTQNNKIYSFIVDDAGKSAVLEYTASTKRTAVVIADVRTGDDQVLNFNANNLITGINILDDMLFFTDNLNEPRKINISTFKAGSPSGPRIDSTTTLLSKKTNTQIAFTAEDINVIKKAPKKAAEMELFASNIGNGNLKGTGVNPLTTEAINFSTLNSTTSSLGSPKYTAQNLSFGASIDSINLFKDKNVTLSAEVVDQKGQIEKFVLRGRITSIVNSTTLQFTPHVVPQNIIDLDVNWELLIDEPDFIYKREFPRFSYRWRYNDGEYSSLAPFTQPAFLPGLYKYEGMDAENEAMLNHLRKIVLKFPIRESTYGPPRDVEFVEVLYKSEKSNNIYVIKTAQLVDPNTQSLSPIVENELPVATGGAVDPLTGNPLQGQALGAVISGVVGTSGEFDEFIIKQELDGPIIESSQLLRLFDAVPKKALAQEIIANRIVYGNYTEGYDENDEPIIIQTGLAGGDSFVPATTTKQQLLLGSSSLKSDKTYQLGVAFLDEFNRESPVLTNDNAIVNIRKDRARLSNQIVASVKTSAPSWAKFFKYYVKDNYSTEYNLLLDRYYDAGDGNFWLSFPSAERNKITEKDILVLKKQHGQSIPVVFDNEYKVIDIENTAPEALKINNLDIIARATCSPKDTGLSPTTPIGVAGSKEIVFRGPGDRQNHEFFREAGKARAIQFLNPHDDTSVGNPISVKSKIYKLESLGPSEKKSAVTAQDIIYKATLEEELSIGDAAAMGFSNLVSADDDSIDIIIYGSNEFLTMEYQGRFFVKVEKRANFFNDIIAPAKTVDIATHVSKRTPENVLDHVALNYTFVNGAEQFVPGVTQELTGGGATVEVLGFATAQGGLTFETERFAQIGFQSNQITGNTNDPTANNPEILPGTTISGTSNKNQFTLLYGPTNSPTYVDPELTSVYYSMDVGAKFRFTSNRNTTAAFTVTAVSTLTSGTTPSTAVAAAEDVVHRIITIDRDYTTANGGTIAAADIDGIEIVVDDATDLLTTNPAVFEVKPQKNVDLDIYYEASDAFPIADLADLKTLNYSNCISFGNGVESTRIADDFNAPNFSKGVRVSSILKRPFKEETRASDLIFSGIVNSRSDVNNSNQFLIAENTTKSINPRHGSIQKLFARDGELLALCEDKCFQILADKDALFNADGSAQLTASNNVLGQIIPFAGEFGISKNPESFVSYGFRSYFTDKSRGVVLRLSRNGLTEISEQGMSDYFQDKFISFTGTLIGSYDESMGTYNLKVGTSESISYDEGNQGWCTRLTYAPEAAISLDNNYYSFNNGQIYRHNNTTRGNFYGTQENTTVTVIFNDAPSSIKNYKTIFYEGDSDWTVDLETDRQTGITNNTLNPDLASSNSTKFFEREGKYYNFISNDALTWSNALSHSAGTQTGNLDTAEFAVQGIGNTSGYSDGSDATVSFATSLTFPSSMQADTDDSGTGDQFFYVNSSSGKIYKLGEITGIDQSAGTITVTKQVSDVPAVLPQTGGGDFAFFVKDPQANTSGILGYFNKATFTNTGTGKNELFAVGTEVFISS